MGITKKNKKNGRNFGRNFADNGGNKRTKAEISGMHFAAWFPMVCQPRNPYLLAGSRGRSYNLGSFMSSETLVAGIRLQSQPVHQLLAAKMEPDEEEQELLRQIQEGTLHESKKSGWNSFHVHTVKYSWAFLGTNAVVTGFPAMSRRSNPECLPESFPLLRRGFKSHLPSGSTPPFPAGRWKRFSP